MGIYILGWLSSRDAVEGQYGSRVTTRTIWKCPRIKLFITNFRHLEKRHPYWPERTVTDNGSKQRYINNEN
jgi:hypothetical protein